MWCPGLLHKYYMSIPNTHTLAAAQVSVTGGDFDLMFQGLTFCAGLRQLTYGPWGMVAWIRCEPEHLVLFYERDWQAILSLPRREFVTGPVLLVAEMLTFERGGAVGIIRKLAALPGVLMIGGWKGDRFRLRRTRQARAGRGIRHPAAPFSAGGLEGVARLLH